MKKLTKILSLLLCVLMIASIAACAPKAETPAVATPEAAKPAQSVAPAPTAAPEASAPPAKEWKIGLVAAGKFGDNGLNDALKAAVTAFTAETGIPVTAVEVSELGDHEIHARNFGEQGYDMVIMGGTVSEIMPTVLEDYPNTRFVLNKGTVDGFANCTSIQFEEPQAGFIGGMFAVLMSQHLGGGNKVGWIGGMRINDLEMCRFSFQAGAHYAGGEAVATYVGDFQDIAKAKELALQMYGEGMVIVQAFAGGAANGVYQAVESLPEGNYAMGAATGQFHLSPNRILASHVIKTDEYFKDVCKKFIAGELPTGIVKAGLKDGATGIRISPNIGDKIPQEIKDKMAEVEKKIISGEIVPPLDEASYNAFIAK